MFKRALGDEYDTLLCLKLICGEDAASHQHNVGAAKLVSHPSGLFTVAVCVMSNYRHAARPLFDLPLTLSYIESKPKIPLT